jgi:hypothetical protein
VSVDRDALLALSKDDLVAIILAQAIQIEAQAAQIAALVARVADLEARLNAPVKTPGNSSMPPCNGHKPNHPFILERVTNISMGTEVDSVNEFEDIVCLDPNLSIKKGQALAA